MKLYDKVENKKLKEIAEKVSRSVPVDKQDAVYMLKTNDILDLGMIAHYLRTKLNGDTAYYGVNMNLNYTNICELRCPLCAFSCDKGDAEAYALTHKEIEKRVRDAIVRGIDEVHIVGGLNPELPLEYFEGMLELIKKIKPDIHIVAFTAVEYDYFSKINNIPLEEVFNRLIKAGLNALPGGGAEIFSERIRNVIAPKKITGGRWLKVMSTAHSMGIKTNATMLYNHIEDVEDIVDHIARIRDIQNETGGFKTFVPLQFHEGSTKINPKGLSTGYDDIRLYAVSRIFLHNIPHIKALWMYLGEKMAQVLLRFGADDIGATYDNEKIVHSAGAHTSDHGSESRLISLIEKAGLKPMRVAADYLPRKGALKIL